MGFHRLYSKQKLDMSLPVAVPYRRLRTCLSFLLSIVLASSVAGLQSSRAQGLGASPANATATSDRPQFHQALLDLTNPWTVMCVAAHPDDEDGSTLTLLRRKYGVHTVSLFSTYGEGGQNAVGPELYEELGVIRARETMAAAEVQGSEPHFLGLRDFGFSKSAEEAFRVWGEKEALRRMVLQIRELRPDVIITNHDTTSGHGHHQATGRLILQAFDAAADPKQFPEQLSHVSPWQAQRLFVRTFSGNQTGTTPPQAQPVVTINPNEVDPIRSTTYAQQALVALQKHATQGPWPKTIAPNGARIIRYTLARSAATAQPLPADPKTVLDGLRLPETIAPKLQSPTIDNKPLTESVDKRGEVLVALINARKAGAFTAPDELTGLDPQRFHLMSSRLDRALAIAAGVSLTLNSNSGSPGGQLAGSGSESVLVPGMPAQFSVSIANSGDADIEVKRLELRGLTVDRQLDAAEKLLPATDTSRDAKITVPKTASISVPSSEHLYDGRLFGEPFVARGDLEIEGARFSVTTETRIDVAPAVEIRTLEPSPYVRTPSTLSLPLRLNLTLINHLSTPFRGLVRINGPNLETGREISLQPREQQTVKIEVRAAGVPARITSHASQTAGTLFASIELPESKDSITRRPVPTVYADARVPSKLLVGYVPSFDATLKRSLTALGVEARELSIEDVQKGELSNYDTIIIDNRGYEAHPELIAANDRLLKYAEDGGTLIVFYHKTNEWNPNPDRKRPQLAPYPIILGDERVTEEDAPVTLLQPHHPLLNFPNKITQADFANWIQERGLYFPKEWDQHYAALLATNDKGEKPLNGGLLVGRYGKGTYIYTSLVWYRELRAGIPGAYRVFANMISYGKSIRR
jgi:LmbE family N-acetylglucosaminyl deacetylase